MARSGSPIVETLALFAVVFVLQVIAAQFSLALVVGLFVLEPPLNTNPWTILTNVYAHATVPHLVSNSVALVLFGWPVSRATTRFRFHVFFVTTGAIAGVSQLVLTDVLSSVTDFVASITGLVALQGAFGLEPTAGVLGASGAVFALLGYLLAANRLSVGIGGLVTVPSWLTGVVFLAVAAFVTVATGAPNAALVAHFTGLFVGLVAGRLRVLNPSTGYRSSAGRA